MQVQRNQKAESVYDKAQREFTEFARREAKLLGNVSDEGSEDDEEEVKGGD